MTAVPPTSGDGGAGGVRALPQADGAEVFRSLYPALHRLACVVCPPERDPEDLVQEALVRALRKGSLAGLDSPLAYLRRTVVNLAANERRSLGRLRRATPKLAIATGATADDEARSPSYPSDDVALLLSLGPADRAAVWLADVEGQPAEHIAAVLGCTPEAARTRISRAHKRLRTLLDEEGTAR